MCDVTKDNFDSILPELFGHIDKCAFIAFDTMVLDSEILGE